LLSLEDNKTEIESMSLKSSYQQFAIENCLSLKEGEGGLPFIEVDNEHAIALVSIYGAQVLSYKPKLNDNIENPENDLLFVSEKAYFEQDKAIKGGIPICWPWFGRDPEGLGRQMHGFARNMLWQLEETSPVDNGDTKIVLSLEPTEKTHELWPHDFKVLLTIVIGKTIRLSLKTINTGSASFSITQALHAYFSVSDINQIHVEGLDKVEYIDTVAGIFKTKVQEGDVTVNQEVDRIYTKAPAQTKLLDKKLNRVVIISSKGSKTTVVWNPWSDLSEKSADLENDAYQSFICIETANAADDAIVVEPNESFVIEAEYSAS
jgi:glucose-6-phosphate 1-epimerase